MSLECILLKIENRIFSNPESDIRYMIDDLRFSNYSQRFSPYCLIAPTLIALRSSKHQSLAISYFFQCRRKLCNHLLGVAEQHQRIIGGKQGIGNPGKSRAETAFDDHNRTGHIHV